MIALNEGRRFIAVVEIAEILVGRSAVLAGVAEGLQQAAVVRLLHGSGRRLAEIGVSGREVGELLEALRQRSDEFATIEQGRRHVRLGAIQQCHLFDEVEKPPAASAAHPLAWKDAGPPKRVPVARGTWR